MRPALVLAALTTSAVLLPTSALAQADQLGPRRAKAGGAGASRSSALQILKERYARGKIDHDEYEERRRVLQDE